MSYNYFLKFDCHFTAIVYSKGSNIIRCFDPAFYKVKLIIIYVFLKTFQSIYILLLTLINRFVIVN